MSPKLFIYLGVFVGSTLGGWLGALASHNNWLSWQSLLASAVGAFVGIWVGIKVGQSI